MMKVYLERIPSERDAYLVDQVFLAQYIYNWINCTTMFHCSYNAYEPHSIKINPVERGFVGEVVTECPRAAEIMGDKETSFERKGS